MEKKKNKKQLAIKQFLVYIVSTTDTHITDIINQIRAVKGVVTISIFEPSKHISKNKDFTKLKLKFLQYSDNTEENIKQLKKEILLVNGVDTIILKIRKTDIGNDTNIQKYSEPLAVRGKGGANVLKIQQPKKETDDDINQKE